MKKLIRHHYTIGALLLLLSGIISCKSDKDFLTEKPSTFYTVDNAYSTSSQIDQSLIAIYSQLRDLWANPAEEGWIFVFRGNGTDMYDVASIRRGSSSITTVTSTRITAPSIISTAPGTS